MRQRFLYESNQSILELCRAIVSHYPHRLKEVYVASTICIIEPYNIRSHSSYRKCGHYVSDPKITISSRCKSVSTTTWYHRNANVWNVVTKYYLQKGSF